MLLFFVGFGFGYWIFNFSVSVSVFLEVKSRFRFWQKHRLTEFSVSVNRNIPNMHPVFQAESVLFRISCTFLPLLFLIYEICPFNLKKFSFSSVTSDKIWFRNCHRCTFYLSIHSNPMIVGRDNQDLCFAPYNVDTVDLGAGLATSFTASFDSPVNFWDKPIFLGVCFKLWL